MVRKQDYSGQYVDALELSDIVIGETYIGKKYITPSYLAGAKLTVKKKGRKNAMVKHDAYSELFAVDPAYLEKIVN